MEMKKTTSGVQEALFGWLTAPLQRDSRTWHEGEAGVLDGTKRRTERGCSNWYCVEAVGKGKGGRVWVCSAMSERATPMESLKWRGGQEAPLEKCD